MHLSTLPTVSTDIFPLANGAALAVAEHGRGTTIFLLVANQGIRVTGTPTGSGVPDVYPLADGSAYLVFTGGTGLGIYHLDGHSLSPVRETSQLTALPGPATAAGFAWADRFSAKSRATRQDREQQEAEDQHEEDQQN